jgi:hypothetical protein
VVWEECQGCQACQEQEQDSQDYQEPKQMLELTIVGLEVLKGAVVLHNNSLIHLLGWEGWEGSVEWTQQ